MSDVDGLVKQGIAAYKGGNAAEAQHLLMKAVELDERNEKAWLWLSGAVDSDEDRRICLENVLAINPDNAAARKGLSKLPPADPSSAAPSGNGPGTAAAQETEEMAHQPHWDEEPAAAEGDPEADSDSWTDDRPAEATSPVLPPWVENSRVVEAEDSSGNGTVEAPADNAGAEPLPPWTEVVAFEDSEPGVTSGDSAGDSLAAESDAAGQSFPWQEGGTFEESRPDVTAGSWGDEPYAQEPQPQSVAEQRPYVPESGMSEAPMPAANPGGVIDPAKKADSQIPSSRASAQLAAAKTKRATKKGGGDTILLIVAVGFLLLVILAAAAAIIGPKLLALAEGQAQSSEPVAADDGQAVLAVLRDNLAAYNAEDIDAYMRTIHSAAPGYDQTKDALEDMVGLFDLSANWDRAQVDEIYGNEARVLFTLTTRKISGPEFRDNRIEGVMTLRQDDGQWKIYEQRVDDIEYLN